MTVTIHRHPEDSDLDTAELLSDFEAQAVASSPQLNEVSVTVPPAGHPADESWQAAIAAFIAAQERGTHGDLDSVLAQYPQWADELTEFAQNQWLLMADTPTGPRTKLLAGVSGSVRAPEITEFGCRTESARLTSNHPGLPALPYDLGDYEIQELIASGGMGVVYQARQKSLDRRVALKMLLGAHDPQRFRAEAEAAAGLEHPQIVAIYEVGEYRGVPFYSMQFIDGVDLRELLRQGPLPARKAAELLSSLAGAIDFAHQRGVLHRDLKPGNILIDTQGKPYVADFGLAKKVRDDSERTGAGALLGTPSYMAPEQANGDTKTLTTAIDVYGLGAILYATLTGKAPFSGEHSLQVIWKVTQEPAIAPSQINPRIPRDLEMICMKCLEKKPNDRYASAAELRNDLDRFLQGFPVIARPVSSLERFSRWCQRNPLVAGLIGAVVTLLVLAAVGGSVLAWREYRARNLAEQAQHRESAARQAAVSNLVNSYTNNGRHAQTSGRQAEAVLWYANAAGLAASDEQKFESLVRAQRRQRFVPYPVRATQLPSFLPAQVSYDPQGKFLLLADRSGVLCLWNLDSHDEPRPVPWLDTVAHHQFSPDGRWLALANQYGQLVMVDATTQQVSYSAEFPQAITGLAFAVDSSKIFLAVGDHLQTLRRVDTHWEPEANAGTLTDDRDMQSGGQFPAEIRALHLNPFSAALLLQLTNGDWLSMNPATQQVIALSGPPLVSRQRELSALETALRFVSAEQVLIAESGKVRLWDLLTGKLQTEFNWPLAYSLAGDADRHWLAVGHARHLQLIRPDGFQLASRLSHREPVNTIDFHPQKNWVAAGSLDGRVYLWDTETGRAMGDLNHQNSLVTLKFSPDGRLLTTVQRDGLCRVWQIESPADYRIAHDGEALASWAKVAPSGKTWYIGQREGVADTPPHRAGDRWQEFDWENSRIPLRQIETEHPIRAAVITGDEQWIALAIEQAIAQTPEMLPLSETQANSESDHRPANSSQQLWIYSRNNLDQAPVKLELPQPVLRLQEQPQRSLLAVTLANYQVWLIDAAQGRVVRRLSPDGKMFEQASESQRGNSIPRQTKFSSDGRWLAVFGGGLPLELYSQENHWRPQALPREMAAHEAEFDPHSKFLAAVATPGEIWIWDLANAKRVGAAMQHDEYVYRVRWDPTGKQLATACADNYARIFDWQSGVMVCQSMPQRNDVYDARFSQDGRWLYTIGENGLIVMWSTRDGGFVDQYPVASSTGQSVFWQRAGQLDGDPSGRYLLTSGWRRAVERLDIGRNEVDLDTDVIRLIRSSELASSLKIEHGGAVPITTSEWIMLWREHIKGGGRSKGKGSSF